jgi:GntR family transcriptional regulator
MPLRVTLDYDLGIPIFRQVQDAVTTALATGDIAPDEQLPTIHALARELDVNPNTIIRAYQELEHAGLIVAERGRGTFPAPDSRPRTQKTEALRRILKRTLRECAKEGISEAEMMLFLKRELGR